MDTTEQVEGMLPDGSGICFLTRSGIRVHYCAEQFENDESMSSSVLKTLKRSVAPEYSRVLSVKVRPMSPH
jgi:hypothetical protein